MENSFYSELTIIENRFMEENVFKTMQPEDKPLPTYEAEKDNLPLPVWDGHADALRCYDKAWQLAFGNLCKPTPGTGCRTLSTPRSTAASLCGIRRLS